MDIARLKRCQTLPVELDARSGLGDRLGMTGFGNRSGKIWSGKALGLARAGDDAIGTGGSERLGLRRDRDGRVRRQRGRSFS